MEELIAIVAILSTIALPIVLGIYFALKTNKQKHIERMEMLKQGLMPPTSDDSEPNKMKNLRTGLILFGIGLGLMIGFIGKQFFHVSDDNFGILMGASVLLSMGAAYFIYFQISKKQSSDQNQQ